MCPALCLALCIGLAGACADARPGPNVLLISIDTLRPDHLGCYGYGRETSPAIDRLAREGVLFENHISSTSWTLPAHAALFTGLADSVHGCVDATGTALAPGFTTLAERFQGGGWTTAGFFAGPYLHPAFGLAQGFEHYEDCSSVADLDAGEVDEWAMDAGVMRASHTGITNPRVLAAVREWMEGRDAERPFFAFVHFWDVHFDFTPPAPYDTMFDPGYTGSITGEGFFFDPRIDASLPERDLQHLRALYDGEIRWTDAHVDELLGDLERLGLAEETVVVLTSDHGTEFFEHGGKAHRTTLYDELIRIPLIVRWPGELPGGRRVAEQTRAIDVAPTLLELAGLPPLAHGMGASLVGLARGEPLDFDNSAVSELSSVGRDLRSVRTREGKVLADQVGGTSVWFDLERDPLERVPRPTDEAPELERSYARALERLERAREQRPAGPSFPDVPRGVAGELEALGYTGGDAAPEPPSGRDGDG